MQWIVEPTAKQIDTLNDNIANVQDSLAYIVGNTNTTGSILTVGAFVYVKGHSSIADGLRKVTTSISADASITTSNTEACAEGGLNSLYRNSAQKSFDLFYAYSDSEGQGDISNALLIDLNNIKGNVNRVGKIRSTTTNKPSDCLFGIRQVLAFSASHYFLIIVGVDTASKMSIWTNFYNSGNWEGWKKLSSSAV